MEHYAQLTAEASYREQRALWKVARHRLDARRIEFLAQEEDMLDEELSQKPLSRAGVASPEKATEVRDKVWWYTSEAAAVLWIKNVTKKNVETVSLPVKFIP